MKIPASVPRGVGPALLALLFVWLAPALPAAADLAPKDHSIFVGQDVTVGWKGKHYPVVGVDKNALRILLDRKETTVPMSQARDIRIKQGVKLSNLSASVANLHGSEGTNRTLNSDEIGQLQDGMAMQSMMEFQRDKAVGQAVSAAAFPSTPDPNAVEETQSAPPPTPPTAATPDLDSKITQLAKVGSDRLTESFGPGSALNEGGFTVAFEVSAPVPLEQCYAAVIASYTLAGDTAVLNKISLLPIGLLGPESRKIISELKAFPPGAELKSYRVSLYSRGLEVATNVSARRTEVTRDEAVIFLTMEYLAKHPGETLPPAPVLMVPRPAFVSLLGAASLDQVIYARVGKDGRILRLSTDAAGAKNLSPNLNTAVDQIAFVPALEKGKPVEGVAKLKLGDLVASN